MKGTVETIKYNSKELVVRGGAWLDIMNSCFYIVIDKIKGYDICRENGSNKIFALPNLNND